jgi:hypothetical protein
VRSVLFWDVTQCRVLIPYQCFGTTCCSHLHRSTNGKEQTMTDVN